MENHALWMIKTVHYAGRLFYLTDRELFYEKRLRELPMHIWGCAPAVRTAYNIPAEAGAVVCFANFYDASTLPDELRGLCRTVDSFMHTWGRSWQKVFCTSQITYLIKNAPEPWHTLAWNELLERPHIELHLLWLIIDNGCTRAVQERAWTELRARKPTLRELACICKDKRTDPGIRTEAEALMNRHV